MKFKQYLIEGEITKKDKKKLSQIIMNPKNGTFELEDGLEIKVNKTKSGPELSFSENNDDLIFQLTQLCDSIGYEFDYEEENGRIIFLIKQ